MSKSRPLVVAGIMSGTSADGIDVALVRIGMGRRGDSQPRVDLLAHRAFPFPRQLRAAVLGAMNAPKTSTADLARLHWRLGLACAEAVNSTIRNTGIRPGLIGCHGQTVYHQGLPASWAGRRFACTWQLGEAAVIAAECGVPVVSNFRPADMAAGGQGAPLVPLFDYIFFAHPKRARVLLNIGGIANLTAIPARAARKRVIAFDTGPGNMVIDALMQRLYGRRYDQGGQVAARGKPLDDVVVPLLKGHFFQLKPPKTAGREQFGVQFADRFLAACRKVSRKPEDAVASATALTSHSICDAFLRWVRPLIGPAETDWIASGGGAQNHRILETLKLLLQHDNCTIITSDAIGFPAEAKEAAAFALLAWQTWHHRPGNLPSATGAVRPAILGQITYV
jgi:anhydro-N-acetylmuramic acid kinase